MTSGPKRFLIAGSLAAIGVVVGIVVSVGGARVPNFVGREMNEASQVPGADKVHIILSAPPEAPPCLPSLGAPPSPAIVVRQIPPAGSRIPNPPDVTIVLGCDPFRGPA